MKHKLAQKNLQSIQQWFESELGQELLEAEKRAINRLLPSLFGYFLVEIAISPLMNLAADSLIGHKISTSTHLQLGLSDSAILCEPTELPFEHNSIDVVLLHHSLDFTDNPHQVLREAIRVLRPGGYIITVGFNPASWWGIRKLCKRSIKAPWQRAQFISHGRLADWMSLLGLTELRSLTDYYLPPLVSKKWRHKFIKTQAFGRRSTPKNGAFTVTLARKDIEGMTPVKRLALPRKFYRLPVRKAVTREQLIERS